FRHWNAPVWLKLTVGGLGVGAISLVNPAVWGNGYSVVNSILQGGWVWQALLAVLIFKVLAVSMTVGSGAVGGVFTPILFVGAVTGALFGGAVQWLWPALLPESASVAVGMGAFLAACTHAPLMSVLMIFEMTESYNLIVPLMLSCVLAYFVSRVLRPASIYNDHARNSRHAPALTMACDFLRLNPPLIRMGESVAELEKVFLQFRWQHVYVVNDKDQFLGAISLHDFSPLMRSLTDASVPWPESLLKNDYPRVEQYMPIWQMMEAFASHPGERLPVIGDTACLLGYITKTDIVLIFSEQLST
ncbi:MAG: chloride channel protein, partial [Rhodoferax sp.]